MNWTADGLERVKAASRGNTTRLGVRHTDESKAKMSAAHRVQPRQPHSEETKRKMSDAALGRTFSAATRAKMSAAAKARCARTKGA